MAQNDKDKSCENCIVRQFNNLSALNTEELKKVSESKITKKVKKGETIFEQGETLNGVFCIREGVTKLSKLSSNGKDQILRLVTKGELLGKSSIISEEKSNLEAIALNDTEVCFIPKEKIAVPLKTNPQFTLEVLKTMVNDLKESNDSILRLSQKNVKQRIAQTLLYLKKNYGEDDEGFLKLNLQREDLANVIGTAVETCIRNVSLLKANGYIELSGKKIAIKDSKKLKRFIEDFKN
jgi:CRP-like cAMP-binding protein